MIQLRPQLCFKLGSQLCPAARLFPQLSHRCSHSWRAIACILVLAVILVLVLTIIIDFILALAIILIARSR